MKELKEFLVGLTAFLLLFIIMPCVTGTIETQYTTTGIVVQADNEILIEDRTGNIWAIEDENFKVGDEVKLIMFTNYTDNTITDDVIKKVKKI